MGILNNSFILCYIFFTISESVIEKAIIMNKDMPYLEYLDIINKND